MDYSRLPAINLDLSINLHWLVINYDLKGVCFDSPDIPPLTLLNYPSI